MAVVPKAVRRLWDLLYILSKGQKMVIIGAIHQILKILQVCKMFLCIVCHWANSDSWRPWEWVTCTVSHPHQPCSAPVHSPYVFFNGVSSSGTCSSSSCCLLPFCITILLSQEPCLLMMCPKQGRFSFVVFVSSNVSGLMCSRTHLFIFLVVQCICKTLLQRHISDHIFFFYQSFSLPNFHICT